MSNNIVELANGDGNYSVLIEKQFWHLIDTIANAATPSIAWEAFANIVTDVDGCDPVYKIKYAIPSISTSRRHVLGVPLRIRDIETVFERNDARAIETAVMSWEKPFFLSDVVSLPPRLRGPIAEELPVELTVDRLFLPVFGNRNHHGIMVIAFPGCKPDRSTITFLSTLAQQTHQTLTQFANGPVPDRVFFTNREKAVAELLITGYENKEIARALGVSPNTVDTHLRRIFHKLDVDNRVSAALLIACHALC